MAKRTNDGSGSIRYDPADFIIPAQDHNGHSERVFCRVQPALDREVDSIVQSRQWPFKTKGDMVRWCVWQGAKSLERMEPVPNSFMAVCDNIITTCRDRDHWLAFQTSLDVLQKSVEMHMNSGSEGEAMKLLAECRAKAMLIEEPVWREKYINDMNKRFGHIYERTKGKGVKLHEVEI